MNKVIKVTDWINTLSLVQLVEELRDTKKYNMMIKILSDDIFFRFYITGDKTEPNILIEIDGISSTPLYNFYDKETNLFDIRKLNIATFEIKKLVDNAEKFEIIRKIIITLIKMTIALCTEIEID